MLLRKEMRSTMSDENGRRLRCTDFATVYAYPERGQNLFRTARTNDSDTVYPIPPTVTPVGGAATRSLPDRLTTCLPANCAGRVSSDGQMVAVYQQYRPLVFARCSRLLDSRDEGEDATQEVFVRALKHSHALPTGPQTALWLCRVATNLCLNKIRDRKLRARRTQEWTIDFDTSGMVAEQPEEETIRRDSAARLLASLAPRHRIVAWLHYIDELDQQEVADRLGVSRRTVVSRLAELTDGGSRSRGRGRAENVRRQRLRSGKVPGELRSIAGHLIDPAGFRFGESIGIGNVGLHVQDRSAVQ